MDSILSFLVPIILVVLVLLVLAANVRVVPQSRAFVIERLGAFQGVWGVGLHFKIPFIERVAKNVSLKEQVVDFPPQPVITKDNVTMQIDTVIYFQITDPKLYTYGVENPMSAIENLTATTLRNIIGDLELDQSLTHRWGLGAGPAPPQPRPHQRSDAGHSGRGHRQLGHQGQPGGAEEHHAAQRHSGVHGEADAGRARAP